MVSRYFFVLLAVLSATQAAPSNSKLLNPFQFFQSSNMMTESSLINTFEIAFETAATNMETIQAFETFKTFTDSYPKLMEQAFTAAQKFRGNRREQMQAFLQEAQKLSSQIPNAMQDQFNKSIETIMQGVVKYRTSIDRAVERFNNNAESFREAISESMDAMVVTFEKMAEIGGTAVAENMQQLHDTVQENMSAFRAAMARAVAAGSDRAGSFFELVQGLQQETQGQLQNQLAITMDSMQSWRESIEGFYRQIFSSMSNFFNNVFNMESFAMGK